MKHTTILLLIALISITATAQKCKYTKNKVDEFTGHNVTITKAKALVITGMGFGVTAGVQLKKINDSKYLVFQVTGPNIFTLQEGSSLMLKTSNDDIIEIPFVNTVIADHTYIATINTTVWSGEQTMVLDADLIAKLSDVEIVKIRWYTSEGYIENEVKRKNQKNISELIACIE